MTCKICFIVSLEIIYSLHLSIGYDNKYTLKGRFDEAFYA